jgi:hypothetical protein
MVEIRNGGSLTEDKQERFISHLISGRSRTSLAVRVSSGGVLTMSQQTCSRGVAWSTRYLVTVEIRGSNPLENALDDVGGPALSGVS